MKDTSQVNLLILAGKDLSNFTPWDHQVKKGLDLWVWLSIKEKPRNSPPQDTTP